MPFRRTAALILLLAPLSACVLKSEHDVTVADNLRLAGDLAAATKERDALRTQNADIQKRLTDLEARNEELSNTNQILANKNSEYSRRSLEAQQELLRVKDEKAKTEEKIDYATKTYDDLVRSLKDEIAEGQVAVAARGSKVSVNVSEKVLFPSGSDVLQPEGKSILKKIVDILRKAKDKQIEVEGHTDNVPIHASRRSKINSNWALSTARAVNVVIFLQGNGVDPDRLAAVGYGEHRPVAPNSTAEGRRRNRRIEIVLAPRTADSTP